MDSNEFIGRYYPASLNEPHAHSRTGPYGFSKASARYDKLVCEAISENRLQSILKIDPNLVKQGKPDSLWQMAMLAGLLQEVKMKGELVSYQVPTYYGMICAGFHRLR